MKNDKIFSDMDKGPWSVVETGMSGKRYPVLFSDDFTYDVVLKMDGDFPECKADEYADLLAKELNFAKNARNIISILQNALKFYSIEENYYEDYDVDFPFRSTKINHDRGHTAQTALEAIGQLNDEKNTD